jgi:hypothetical protein
MEVRKGGMLHRRRDVELNRCAVEVEAAEPVIGGFGGSGFW